MTLDEVKASCQSPLDIKHTSSEDDTVTSSLLHTVAMLGLGQEIAVRGSMVMFTMRGGRVSTIFASGTVGRSGPSMDRKEAEAAVAGIGERLAVSGWRTHKKVSPLITVYARDQMQLTVRLDDLTGTQAAKEHKVSGEYFTISLILVDVSKSP